MFELPPSQFQVEYSSSSSSDDDNENENETESSSYDTTESSSPTKTWDLHSIDEKSVQFKSLPADVRHEILTELKETRKQNSWGRIHELPTQSDDFSGYQMKRLLKRYSIQVSLEEAEKEMGGASLSLGELESLLKDHGVVNNKDVGGRIAADENKRYFYIKSMKKALEDAKIKENEEDGEISVPLLNKSKDGEIENIENLENDFKMDVDEDLVKAIQLSLQDVPSTSKSKSNDNLENVSSEKGEKEVRKTIADKEYEEDLEKAIKLSLQQGENSVNINDYGDVYNDLFMNDSDSDIEPEEEAKLVKNRVLASAKNYMMEYSGLTPSEIAKIISGDHSKKSNLDINSGKKIEDKFVDFKKPQLSKLLVLKNGENKEGKIESKESSKASLKESSKELLKESSKQPLQESSKELLKESSNEQSKESINLEEEKDLNLSKENKTKDLHKNQQKDAKNVPENHHLTKISNDSNIDSSNFLDLTHQKSISTQSNKETSLISNDSDSDSSDFIEVKNQNVSKSTQSNKIKEISTVSIDSDSNSDSSDFLEVEPEISIPTQTKSNVQNKNGLEFEIMIKKDEKFDDNDDIFSDIFKEENDSNIDDRNQCDHSNTEKDLVPAVVENLQELNKDESIERDLNIRLLNEVMDVAGVENVQDLNKERLERVEMELSVEKDALLAKQSLKERLATNISEQMRTEVQELLRLFGVPYVVAPMEAEAQCAFLDEINLTDGTITDDSDIWLFGGKTVYKNFFNQSKRVLEYKSENILHYFKLSRYEMILLALLVGSDYTTGIQGIGPVTALEILAHFPFKKQDKKQIDLQNELVTGLREFKRWIKGEYNLKGRATLRKKLKNITLNDQFPSIQVVGAYLEPTVETSDEHFTWSKPDVVSLIDFAKEKFGWNQSKSEEILKPVFKSLEKSDVQSKITNYFQVKRKIDGTNIDEMVSKRVKTALNKIGKGESSEDEGDDEKSKDSLKIKENKTKTKTKNKSKQITNKKPSNNSKTLSKPSTSKEEENILPSIIDDDLKVLQQTKKVSRKRAKQIENELRYEMEQKELQKNVNPQMKIVKKLHAKEIIPQKQKDKSDMLKSRMKAIETFRKSKQGPGFVKKRSKKANLPKEDAELSEDSDS